MASYKNSILIVQLAFPTTVIEEKTKAKHFLHIRMVFVIFHKLLETLLIAPDISYYQESMLDSANNIFGF